MCAVPFSQCRPWTPGGHKHFPVTGSQRPPFLQTHRLLHRTPYVPSAQAKGERECKVNKCLGFSEEPGRKRNTAATVLSVDFRLH